MRIRICPDCGNVCAARHREVCPARVEAKRQPGYHPAMFRKESAETFRKLDDSLQQVQTGGSKH